MQVVHMLIFMHCLCELLFCRVTLWPPHCLFQLVQPPVQSLRSTNKLLLPKGAACVKTHLSPADGGFSGHTVPPARLPSRAWPSPQPAQQATGITSPCWQDPFYGLRVCNTSSNAGHYPAFSLPLQSTLSTAKTPVCDTVCCSNAKNTQHLFCVLCINCVLSALKWRTAEKRHNCLKIVLKRTAGLAFCFHVSLRSHSCLVCFPSFCSAMPIPFVWGGEVSIAVAIKNSKSNAAVLWSDFPNNSTRSSWQIQVWDFYIQDIHHSNPLTTHPHVDMYSSINTYKVKQLHSLRLQIGSLLLFIEKQKCDLFHRDCLYLDCFGGRKQSWHALCQHVNQHVNDPYQICFGMNSGWKLEYISIHECQIQWAGWPKTGTDRPPLCVHWP